MSFFVLFCIPKDIITDFRKIFFNIFHNFKGGFTMSTRHRNLIKNIYIKKFRKLKEIKFDIAERITVIAGHNGIGKSSILGLIANGSELKGHHSYFDKIFQSKFEEIFHLDINYDYTKNKEDKYSVLLKYEYNNHEIYKHCTVTKHGKRLRVVPRNVDEEGKQIKQTISDVGPDAKVPIPTLYIGMSRVIPIGESKREHYTLTQTTIHEEDLRYLIECFKQILGDEDFNEERVSKQYLKYSTKRSIGPDFQNYSYKSISLGQDSLSSILTAVISFKKLKRELGDQYHGGILVIDEVDACLHPSAQRNLLEVLDAAAKKLDLQIICTSHSLTVIQEVLSKQINTQQNKNDQRIYYNVVYIQDTIRPRIMKNPSYKKIKNDMFLRLNLYQDDKQDVKVYFEDDEAIFFFNQIEKIASDKLETDGLRLEKISTQINCDTLSKLPNKDSYFRSVIIVLDGDVSNKGMYKHIIDENKNICTLPGSESPEKIIHLYLEELINDTDHRFWADNQENITVQLARDHILKKLNEELNGSNDKRKRDIYKKRIFETTNIISYWLNDNSEEVQKFIDGFNNSMKYIRTFYIQNHH